MISTSQVVDPASLPASLQTPACALVSEQKDVLTLIVSLCHQDIHCLSCLLAQWPDLTGLIDVSWLYNQSMTEKKKHDPRLDWVTKHSYFGTGKKREHQEPREISVRPVSAHEWAIAQ